MSFLKSMVLNFSKFDKYILLNYPIAWETRLHIIIPCCTLAWGGTSFGLIALLPVSGPFAPDLRFMFPTTLALSTLLWSFWLWRVAKMSAHRNFGPRIEGMIRYFYWLLCTIAIYSLPWIAGEATHQNIRLRLNRTEVFDDLLRIYFVNLAESYLTRRDTTDGNSIKIVRFDLSWISFSSWCSSLEPDDAAMLFQELKTRPILCSQDTERPSIAEFSQKLDASIETENACRDQLEIMHHLSNRFELHGVNWECGTAKFDQVHINKLSAMKKTLITKYGHWYNISNVPYFEPEPTGRLNTIRAALRLGSKSMHHEPATILLVFTFVSAILWLSLSYYALRIKGTIGGLIVLAAFGIIANTVSEIASTSMSELTFILILSTCMLLTLLSLTIRGFYCPAKRLFFAAAAAATFAGHSIYLLILYVFIWDNYQPWHSRVELVWLFLLTSCCISAVGLLITQRWLNRYHALPEK